MLLANCQPLLPVTVALHLGRDSRANSDRCHLSLSLFSPSFLSPFFPQHPPSSSRLVYVILPLHRGF